MYQLVTVGQFNKDYKKYLKSGKKNIQKLDNIIRVLALGQKLEPKFKDHQLTGNFKGRRECHIEPDWLLIYRIENQYLYLERTGSHSELFG